MADEAPELVQARVELLGKFKAALTDWHNRTEELDDENLMLAAAQGPRPPGPEIEQARSFINRNLVAAHQAVQDAGIHSAVAGNVGGTIQNLDPFINVFGKPFGQSLISAPVRR